MAQAPRQTAPTFVFLKVAVVALENLGLGDAGVKRCVVEGCGDGSIPYHHEGAKPPPGFWRGHLSNFTFDGSDITNAVGDGIYAFTLRNVKLSWEALVAKHPELGAEPPRLGTSRVEVTAAPSFMRWFETTKLGALVAKLLQRAASVPEARQDPQKWFDQALKDHPQAPGERDARYIDRLHELMKNAPVTKVWPRPTVERRFYEGRQAGDTRRG